MAMRIERMMMKYDPNDFNWLLNGALPFDLCFQFIDLCFDLAFYPCKRQENKRQIN